LWSDPRVDGFETLDDRGCRETLYAFLRTSGYPGAQVSIVQQAGHGLAEFIFVARRHKQPAVAVHDHIDYASDSGCDHRAAAGHGFQHGCRTGIKTRGWKHGKKAAAKRCHSMIMWPLAAHLDTVGKVRRSVRRAPAYQQQWRTSPAEGLVGAQQPWQTFIFRQLANKKKKLLLRQARRCTFGPALSRIT